MLACLGVLWEPCSVRVLFIGILGRLATVVGRPRSGGGRVAHILSDFIDFDGLFVKSPDASSCGSLESSSVSAPASTVAGSQVSRFFRHLGSSMRHQVCDPLCL